MSPKKITISRAYGGLNFGSWKKAAAHHGIEPTAETSFLGHLVLYLLLPPVLRFYFIRPPLDLNNIRAQAHRLKTLKIRKGATSELSRLKTKYDDCSTPGKSNRYRASSHSTCKTRSKSRSAHPPSSQRPRRPQTQKRPFPMQSTQAARRLQPTTEISMASPYTTWSTVTLPHAAANLADSRSRSHTSSIQTREPPRKEQRTTPTKTHPPTKRSGHIPPPPEENSDATSPGPRRHGPTDRGTLHRASAW